MIRFRGTIALAAWAVSAWTVAAGSVPADESLFRDKVAPIFERRCVRCHAGDKPKGGLSLVTAAKALAGGESGTAIEPGKPDESLLLEYVSGEKPEMPKEGPPLAPEEVSAIRGWIKDGARWSKELTLLDKRQIDANWWSLKPLLGAAPPKVDSAWVRTPIDAFVLAKLQANGLAPSPEADRRTLIRRLSFNLHGLPPTPDEIEAFVADASPDAYERLVDRLLASPRYGERWGRHWLDVVHYGESHGYDKDKPRPNAWPYRDYVIAALNADKPYHRFVQEQIAGDVLFSDDPQATVATGFIAAGPWDFVGHVELREGTVDKDIARSNDRDDMVATTMSTFLSLTVHCARCHNHKFDPIKQEDYYSLQAVFAGVDRADRPYDTDLQRFAARRALAAQEAALASREKELAAKVDASAGPEVKALEGRVAALQGRVKALAGPAGAPSPTNGYHSAIMPTADEVKWVQIDLGKSAPIERVRLLPARPTDFPDTPGFGFPARFKVEISDDARFKSARAIADHTQADYANPGDRPVEFDGGKEPARFVRITATRLWLRSGDYVFALAEAQVQSEGRNAASGATVTALDSIEAGRWSTANLVDGFDSRQALAPATSSTASQEERARLEAQLQQSTQEARLLREKSVDRVLAQSLDETRKRLADVGKQLKALGSPQMVYAAASSFVVQGSFTAARAPRPVHLLLRGNVRSLGPLMSPAGVACVPGPPSKFDLAATSAEGDRRAALARWLTDPSNVLARRSIVNRVWHYHFGQGLVDTPNDFGRMGSQPSHPELLDWLAQRFIADGESLKSLHRLISTSAVYRQSSADNAHAAAVDSGNRFLWRMNRARLDAESVRDAMLSAAGKLDATMGGPSVQQFYFKDDHSPVYDYARFDVDDPRAYRRSVYRFIVRSVPDPFMDCMDAADSSLLTPKRNTTLTAIQALAMLNNRFVVRQAEHLAERAEQLRADPLGRIEAAFRLAIGRAPGEREAALLLDYASKHGLASACRVILNSNEFMFVD